MAHRLIEMLSWKRPSGSEAADIFGEVFLQPIFGTPDKHGNYMLVMGKDPKVSFTAHYDTVHSTEGLQRVIRDGDTLSSDSGECLGADCTTGIYIILEMIKKGIPGVYYVFANEEVGCLGSGAVAKELAANPAGHPLEFVDIMISFDRFGTDSIITHQSGYRTASDEFAKSLADELEMPMKADPTGSYTDSNEFADLINECTNVSVGYYSQHTKKETQDLAHLSELIYNLMYVEWDELLVARDCTVVVEGPWSNYSNAVDDDEEDLIETIVYENGDLVANLLMQLGYSSSSLIDELQIDHPWYSYNNQYYN